MNPYEPYPNLYPMNQFMGQVNQMVPQAQIHTPKVNGREGANSFNMPPNSDALLLDQNEDIIWFVRTDGAGYKTVLPYDFSEHKEVKQEDVLKSMEQRLSKIEEALNNGKFNNSAINNKQRNDAGGRGNAQG